MAIPAGAKAALSQLINKATASPGTRDEDIAEVTLGRLTNCDATTRYKNDIAEFLTERGIGSLFHFTRRENLKQILSSGLLPRVWLEKPPIRNALRPRFSDEQRWDGRKDSNCLSISFPNYRMFFSKAQTRQHEWVVLEFEATVLECYRAEFAPMNLSKKGVKPTIGVQGAQRMFCNWPLREALRLKRCHTTCPEAEALVGKILLPNRIRAIHFHPKSRNSAVVAMAKKRGIPVVISERMFRPRQDYRYWTNCEDFDPGTDYEQVRANERALS
jgi:hypothetical protein